MIFRIYDKNEDYIEDKEPRELGLVDRWGINITDLIHENLFKRNN